MKKLLIMIITVSITLTVMPLFAVDFLVGAKAWYANWKPYLADVGIKMNFRKLEGDVAAQLNALPDDPVAGPANIVWDLGYGARAALALQEYYNAYATGISAHTPGDPEMDALIQAINGTSDESSTQSSTVTMSLPPRNTPANHCCETSGWPTRTCS